MDFIELNCVLEIRNGYAFKSDEFRESGIPLVRISNIENGVVNFNGNTIKIDESYLDTKSDYTVEKGDIVIALSGATTGKYGVYEYDFPSLLNQRIGLIKAGKSKKIELSYFYYYLSIIQKDILRKAFGAAQPNISTKEIGRFKIPLPPLSTQQQIARILDQADALRKKTQQVIDLYDQLAQSIFLDMFGDTWINRKGYELVKLSRVVKDDKIITYGIVQAGPNIDGGVPYIRTGDIQNGKINTASLLRTTHKIARSYERSKCSFGDIIMSIRATVGTIAFLPKELEGANLTQGTARISPNETIVNKRFLYYCIKSRGIQLKIDRMTKGATFREITLGRLRNIEIPLPPITLQNQFAEKISLIEKQKELAKQSLQESENLFNSLLQKAFKGELVNSV